MAILAFHRNHPDLADSISKLQRLSQQINAGDARRDDNESEKFLSQGAIHNFILSLQKQQLKHDNSSLFKVDSTSPKLDNHALLQTQKELAQIELAFLSHLQKNASALPKIDDLANRTKQHQSTLKEKREQITTKINEYSAQIPQAAPYKPGEIETNPEFKAEAIYAESSLNIKSLIQTLIEESKKDLTRVGINLAEDIDYSIICFGSLSRKEASPYSDLEFGILLGEEMTAESQKVATQYFRDLTNLLNLKIINLGETTATIQGLSEVNRIDVKTNIEEYQMREEKESFTLTEEHVEQRRIQIPIKNGLSFDGNSLGSCKTPLGNMQASRKKALELRQNADKEILAMNDYADLSAEEKISEITHIENRLNAALEKLERGKYELIMTPSQMAQLHNQDWHDVDPHLSNALFSADILAASSDAIGEKLLKRYQEEVNETLSEVISEEQMAEEFKWQLDPSSQTLPTLRKVRASNLIKEALSKFEAKAGRQQDGNREFSPKYDFYRPATMLIDHLSYLYGIGNKEGERSVWERFNRLFTEEESPLLLSGDFDEKEVQNLRWMLDRVMQIRLKHYMDAQNQDENMRLLENAPREVQTVLMKDDMGVRKNIFEVYFSMTPFYNAVKRFNETGSKGAQEFKRGSYYLDDAYSRARIHHLLSDYSKAEESYQEAKKEYEENGLGNDADVAAIFNNLGNLYHARGQYDEMINAYEDALAIYQDTLGEDHPDTTITRSNLGLAWGLLGNHNEELSLLQLSLEKTKSLGEDPTRMAELLNNIATAHESLSQPQDAITLYQDALNLCDNSIGRRNATAITILNNLGNILDDNGRFTESIRYLNQALSLCAGVYGDEHEKMAAILANLAVVQGNLGHYQEQGRLLENSLTIVKRISGNYHPNVASILNDLGDYYRKIYQPELARKVSQQALDIYTRHFGEEHELVATALGTLGSAHGACGDRDLEKEYLTRSQEIFEKVLGPNHINTTKMVLNRSNAANKTEDYDEALEFAQQSLERFQGVDETHPGVISAKLHIADSHIGLNDYAKAIEVLRELTEMFEKHRITNEMAINAMQKLTSALVQHANNFHISALKEEQEGNVEEAKLLLEKADMAFQESIQESEKLFVIDPEEMDSAHLLEYSNFLYQQNRYPEALINLDKILALEEEYLILDYDKKEQNSLPVELQHLVEEETLSIQASYLTYFLLIEINQKQGNFLEAQDLLMQFSDILARDKIELKENLEDPKGELSEEDSQPGIPDYLLDYDDCYVMQTEEKSESEESELESENRLARIETLANSITSAGQIFYDQCQLELQRQAPRPPSPSMSSIDFSSLATINKDRQNI